MIDKEKVWHGLGIAVTVGFALFGVISLLSDQDKSQKADQIREIKTMEIRQQAEQKKEEEAHSKDPAYQVTSNYDTYKNLQRRGELGPLEKSKLREATDQLREWIPRYREELMEKRSKALSEGNSSTVSYCDEKLSWLSEIEKEVLK